MTPEDAALLQHAGKAFVFDVSMAITQSVLYGLYLPIFAFGIRALLKRHPRTRYTWILFGFLSVLFLLATANLAVPVTGTIKLLQEVLINNFEKSLAERFLIANASTDALVIAEVWLGSGGGGGFLFIFADAVVVWRACMLWAGNKAVRILLIALLVASLGSAIASATLNTIAFVESSAVPSSSPTGIMLALGISMSLATNVAATVLIGYQAYQHRQSLKTSAGGQGSRTGVILLFLTESGIVFCVLQVLALATSTADNDVLTPLSYAANVLQHITVFAAVSYPVLILIIVDSHRSISDHTGGSGGDSGFAQGPGAGSLGVESHVSFAARQRGAGTFSSSGGFDSESVVGPRIPGAHHVNGVSVQYQGLEKGRGFAGAPVHSC